MLFAWTLSGWGYGECPFPQVFCSIPGFVLASYAFWMCHIQIVTHFYPFSTIFTHFPSLFSPHHGEPEKAGVM